MRLAFAMELVLALAVGLGLARWGLDPEQEGEARANRDWYILVIDPSASVLAGVGLVVGLGTWLEAARRRGPTTWGPGRWAWSVAGAFLLVANARRILGPAIFAYKNFLYGQPGANGPPKPAWVGTAVLSDVLDSLRAYHARGFSDEFANVFAALAVTYVIARPARNVPTDARERVGRVYAVLVIALGVAEVARELWHLV